MLNLPNKIQYVVVPINRYYYWDTEYCVVESYASVAKLKLIELNKKDPATQKIIF